MLWRCAKCMKAHNSLLHLLKPQTSMVGGSENADSRLPQASRLKNKVFQSLNLLMRIRLDKI